MQDDNKPLGGIGPSGGLGVREALIQRLLSPPQSQPGIPCYGCGAPDAFCACWPYSEPLDVFSAPCPGAVLP